MMLGLTWSWLLLSLTVAVYARDTYPLKIRIVTWNVADNDWAEGKGFTPDSIKAVLGLDTDDAMPDIYAVGLQEQCWGCTPNSKVGDFPKITKVFLDRLNKDKKGSYKHISSYATKMSVGSYAKLQPSCETQCMHPKSHGTSALLIFAKSKGVIAKEGNVAQKFHLNDGCSSQQKPFFRDAEKGFAAVTVKLADGKKLCFANSHLDSKSTSWRRKCFKLFFQEANKPLSKVDWSNSCDAQFLFGDFNTRTEDKTSDECGPGKTIAKLDFATLKDRDELRGTHPYKDGHDKKEKDEYPSPANENLLQYINNKAQSGVKRKATFKEHEVKFNPTYSIRKAATCSGTFPCYCAGRPVSWADRIIYSKGKVLKYEAIENHYGDHLPVVAVIEL